MPILMLQGPDDDVGRPMREALQAELDARARSAGQVLRHERCASEAQLAERLARIDRRQADIILLGPGQCANPAGPVRDALASLAVPYIEVREDTHDRPEPVLPAGPRVALVNGYAAQGYTLAMSLALETLGCADSENEFNVGT